MDTVIYKEQDLDFEKIQILSNDIVDGKIAIFKTETIYGIGTNAYHRNLVRKFMILNNVLLNILY